MRALEPLFDFPGAFVPGNNDYYAPRPKNPLRYFRPPTRSGPTARALPWPELAAAMVGGGWLDLTHVRTALKVGECRGRARRHGRPAPADGPATPDRRRRPTRPPPCGSA